MSPRNNHRPRMFSSDSGNDAYKTAYGNNILVTYLGNIHLVHLDKPSPEMIEDRIQEVLREELSLNHIEEDCPLCRQMKQQRYDIVYYPADSTLQTDP